MNKITRLCRLQQRFINTPATTIPAARITPQRFYSASHQTEGGKREQPEPVEEIGVFKAYGKPVATLFLWSTLTYMALQAVWSKLYFDEVRLETEAKIDNLKEELDRLEKFDKLEQQQQHTS
ncbi:hypothetical protein EV175_002947 [Coemansia sp. RSA 1933]|nr:hypothetical protein EV175_002947 [Coemansia sp. RSA 1933]